ncbi:MAG TPA: aminomethyl-transferring glycine dehydrogenase subunit GcvPB [Bacillota bacterium]|nr:aminomethyl-transferring glycine dehydrogenase subunit GcvPB [Bacillota bacterium]HOA15137.1 aminomethyl-transferring glycine dehydrogenase subunit GcvPB [Bacillota bacterium]HOG52401.1 aminomethyl-transferring glycine dehydrogenase subunit GcvPB [Bacillota bacterium]
MKKLMPLLFEMSSPGRTGFSLPETDVPVQPVESMVPDSMIRKEAPALPELSEVDVVRHFVNLSLLNHGVDTGFYPLGSCTMKYNPKVNEDAARLAGFARLHPEMPESGSQGALKVLHDLDMWLSELCGMDRFTLQPVAGAHGELTGLFIIRAYHFKRGDCARDKVLAPDSSHGTNPASAAAAGMTVVQVASDSRGNVDIEDLKSKVGPDTAGLMLTNPNTLGLFDEHICEITDIVHKAGGLVYYDGANANAIMGKSRPGDMGFDVVHLNLHKTMSTPHGGGGPGAGPVGVKKHLEPFLPKPLVAFCDGKYVWDSDRPDSIGHIHSYNGNFGVLVRAWAYMRSMGPDGLKAASELAVLNANYIMHALKDDFTLAYDRTCKHEFVLSGAKQKKESGVRTLDMAKRLLDYGIHAPTVYFPLIVDEAIMIEPTETESKQTLDTFIDAMKTIAKEARENPDNLRSAPHNTPVGRLDETLAARKPVLRWTKEDNA